MHAQAREFLGLADVLGDVASHRNLGVPAFLASRGTCVRLLVIGAQGTQPEAEAPRQPQRSGAGPSWDPIGCAL